MTTKHSQPNLNIIVCVDSDGGFAKDGMIPWNISEDLKHFKETTSGGICIMGKNTYLDMCEMMIKRNIDVDSLKDILPNRTSFVLTSNKNFKATGAIVMPSIESAWGSLDDDDQRKIFIIGGQRVFAEALPLTSTVYKSILKQSYDCDMFFPSEYINIRFAITSVKETEHLYHLTYQRTI